MVAAQTGMLEGFADARFGSFASILACPRQVRLSPESDHLADVAGCPFGAICGHGR
jgi:hypothetical protein